MGIELDHLFICTSVGAPEADLLIEFGLREGPPNQHPGQGTANRRFLFANAMIELFWVSDADEAQGALTRRTLLWDRWLHREEHACPFGICLRPSGGLKTKVPFPAWDYRPSYLSKSLAMQIGEADIAEPMWVYLDFMRRVDREKQFLEHPNGMREVTELRLTTPIPFRSEASQSVIAHGILKAWEGEKPLIEIEFDDHRRRHVKDFRPHLPLVFRV